MDVIRLFVSKITRCALPGQHVLGRGLATSQRQTPTLSEACQLARTATPPQHTSTVLDTTKGHKASSAMSEQQPQSFDAAEMAAIALQPCSDTTVDTVLTIFRCPNLLPPFGLSLYSNPFRDCKE